MTIAAGIICSDGIIMCADTEHTLGEGRFDRSKIWPHEDWLLVSGAGWADYMKMAFDKIYERFLRSRPETELDARRGVERVVLSIYEKNIGSVFRVGDPSSPEIYLIVAVRCANGKLALIRASYTSVMLSASPYEAVGVGQNVFDYWAKLIFWKPRPIEVSSYFALFILREVKNAVPSCGGGTMVYPLPLDPHTPREYTRFLVDDILAGFPQTALNVFLDAADGCNLDFSIQMLRRSAEDVKGWFKSRAEFRERIKLPPPGADAVSLSPTEPAPLPEQSDSSAPKKEEKHGRRRP